MKKIWIFVLIASLTVLTSNLIFAQTVGELEKLEREIEKEKLLRERIEKEEKEPWIEDKRVSEEAPLEGVETVFIKEIKITGTTLLSQKEIQDIILPFENKELTFKEMQKVADLITDAYRQKGYITSRAYLPPQKIENQILQVSIIEGVTGEIEIKGNRYFKSSLLKRRIALKKGEPFNYDILRRRLSKINGHPDRSSRVVLVPGKEPGMTDILLEVEDRLPIHVGFDVDNYGSRFIEKYRYRSTLSHNNLFGLDDRLSLQYQVAEGDTYWLTNFRYFLPVSNSLEVGFFYARSKLDLAKESKDLDARGKSKLFSLFATQTLIDAENIALKLNLGFDYKDVFNFQLGDEISRDRLRVAKVGFDLDLSDQFGRTIILNEINFGIPNIMGGLRAKDSRASRSRSGGKFVKNQFTLMRLQKMPYDSTFLWKHQVQFTNYTLPAAEQFQIGGVSNVRGYPPAEFVGDRGYTTTGEWSFPPYFLSKNIKIPTSSVTIYDAVRIAFFYDLGYVRLKNAQAGERKTQTLRAAGAGIRITLPKDLSARVDFAWPLDINPTDGDNLHIWFQLSKSF